MQRGELPSVLARRLIVVRGTWLRQVIGAPGRDSLCVVSGNLGNGINIRQSASGVHVLNTYVGVGADGFTAVPNRGQGGVFADAWAQNVVIGAEGQDSVTVISGNSGFGLGINSPGLRVLNTYVGVAIDGMTRVPNRGKSGVYVFIGGTDSSIGSPGEGGTNVVSGNDGLGIAVAGAGTRVLNTYVGVAADGSMPVSNGRVSGAAGSGIYVYPRGYHCTIGSAGVST